jgi:hypothetical protein
MTCSLLVELAVTGHFYCTKTCNGIQAAKHELPVRFETRTGQRGEFTNKISSLKIACEFIYT